MPTNGYISNELNFGGFGTVEIVLETNTFGIVSSGEQSGFEHAKITLFGSRLGFQVGIHAIYGLFAIDFGQIWAWC